MSKFTVYADKAQKNLLLATDDHAAATKCMELHPNSHIQFSREAMMEVQEQDKITFKGEGLKAGKNTVILKEDFSGNMIIEGVARLVKRTHEKGGIWVVRFANDPTEYRRTTCTRKEYEEVFRQVSARNRKQTPVDIYRLKTKTKH